MFTNTCSVRLINLNFMLLKNLSSKGERKIVFQSFDCLYSFNLIQCAKKSVSTRIDEKKLRAVLNLNRPFDNGFFFQIFDFPVVDSTLKI